MNFRKYESLQAFIQQDTAYDHSLAKELETQLEQELLEKGDDITVSFENFAALLSEDQVIWISISHGDSTEQFFIYKYSQLERLAPRLGSINTAKAIPRVHYANHVLLLNISRFSDMSALPKLSETASDQGVRLEIDPNLPDEEI